MDDTKICRLCFQTIFDENFHVIEDELRRLLEALFINLNLNVTRAPLACGECTTNLRNCFYFKQVFVQNSFSVMENKENIISNLTKSSLKQNEKATPNKDSKCQKVCRFCLKPISCIGQSVDLLHTKNKLFLLKMLSKHTPEVNLFITEELIACKNCLKVLKIMNNFIANCLSMEKEINRYIRLRGKDANGYIELNNCVQDTKQKTLKQKVSNIRKGKETSYKKLNVPKKTELQIESFKNDKPLKTNCKNEETSINSQPSDSGSNSSGKSGGETLRNKCPDTKTGISANICSEVYKCHVCPFQTEHEYYLRKHKFVSHQSFIETPTPRFILPNDSSVNKKVVIVKNNTDETVQVLFVFKPN